MAKLPPFPLPPQSHRTDRRSQRARYARSKPFRVKLPRTHHRHWIPHRRHRHHRHRMRSIPVGMMINRGTPLTNCFYVIITGGQNRSRDYGKKPREKIGRAVNVKGAKLTNIRRFCLTIIKKIRFDFLICPWGIPH